MRYFLIALSSLLFVNISGCKKYPEGPTVSLLSRRERIEGKWMASSVKFNNSDSTLLYKDHIWEFTRNYSVILQINNTKKTGIWSTVTNDNEFRIDYDDGTSQQFEIRKLQLKEFWLRDKKSQFDYQLTLK